MVINQPIKLNLEYRFKIEMFPIRVLLIITTVPWFVVHNHFSIKDQ